MWLAVALLAQAGEGDVAPVSKVLAVSEQFEAVGRLETNGLIIYVDRADSNTPVLNARLAVEFEGKSVDATFRPEQGDYLIADAAWLAPLRREGEHALALTLIAGEESDLLTGELDVHSRQSSGLSATALDARWLAAGASLIVALILVLRRRRGGRA
ncbi:MAG: hypothetical protein CFR70_09645 [Rhodocyclaceae bacterium]|nr:MAG: hypothetical protein CFR70_09645 [Rhodocyclaceae bacterium]